jgi:mycothiol synthase
MLVQLWLRDELAVMTDSPYSIRNYQPADFSRFVQLYQEAESLEPIGRPTTPQAIAEKLSMPNYTPEHDLLVIETGGDIIGFQDMLPELGIERIVVDCWLRPAHRGRGMARKLLSYALDRARETGAKSLHVVAQEGNDVAVAILSRLGFRYVRRFLELRIDVTEVDQAELKRAGRGCRHLNDGEEQKLLRIQKKSFAEHWGYNPDTIETITHRIKSSRHSPEDVVLTCKEDRITGYCWTEVTDQGEGRIYMIGSDPDYRGKGIGKKLLLAGLAHLKNKGIKSVWLTVDSENETACSLYQSVGFTLQKSYLWYEKAVD